MILPDGKNQVKRKVGISPCYIQGQGDVIPLIRTEHYIQETSREHDIEAVGLESVWISFVLIAM